MEVIKPKSQNSGRVIVFTGGGSTGHVMLNLSLIPLFRNTGWEIHYIGSNAGIEKRLIEELDYVTYHTISTGKLRRYFDLRNVLDVFRVISGCFEAGALLKKIKPNIIFSKGGYVSFPVVYGGAKNHIPVIAHESDYTPGLANRLAGRYADAICLTFRETQRYIRSGIETIYVGPVIRPDIFRGSRSRGMEYCGFTSEKPVLLVVGGSLGAERVNMAVRAELDQLLKYFQVVHICGKNHTDGTINKKGYKQFEYVGKEFADVLAAADTVISRAGSNAIFEFLAVRKPMLLIPLAADSSRGDQIENAEGFERKGYARVLKDSDCSGNIHNEAMRVYENRMRYISAMESAGLQDDVLKRIFNIIIERAK